MCWQTDWQANWLFQYCKEKEVQCEKRAVTHDLRCVAVFQRVERGEQMSTSYLQRQKRKKQDNLTFHHSSFTNIHYKQHLKDWHHTIRSALFIGPSHCSNHRKQSYLCKWTYFGLFDCLFVLLNPFYLSNQCILRVVMHNPNTWGRKQVRNLIAARTHARETFFFFPLPLCTRQTGCKFDLAETTEFNLTRQHR